MRAELKPIPRSALIGWGAFYAMFLLYIATHVDGFFFLDYANLMFHEAGHAMFGWADYYTQVLGGTIGQLFVPAACCVAFVWRGETTAVAFASFWFFQNFLNIATYMGDARRAALPLVGGDQSDWDVLFTHWGVLQQDRVIAGWMRGIGWIGMLAVVGWFVWRGLADRQATED